MIYLTFRKTNSNGRYLENFLLHLKNLTSVQEKIENSFKMSEISLNKTVIEMTNKLTGLQMNKFCQNKWTHFNGKCYYFSPSKVCYLHVFIWKWVNI